MRVYVVTRGNYDVEVVCAFTLESAARTYCDVMNARLREHDSRYELEEVTLDPPILDPVPDVVVEETMPNPEVEERRLEGLNKWLAQARAKKEQSDGV